MEKRCYTYIERKKNDKKKIRQLTGGKSCNSEIIVVVVVQQKVVSVHPVYTQRQAFIRFPRSPSRRRRRKMERANFFLIPHDAAAGSARRPHDKSQSSDSAAFYSVFYLFLFLFFISIRSVLRADNAVIVWSSQRNFQLHFPN